MEAYEVIRFCFFKSVGFPEIFLDSYNYAVPKWEGLRQDQYQTGISARNLSCRKIYFVYPWSKTADFQKSSSQSVISQSSVKVRNFMGKF